MDRQVFVVTRVLRPEASSCGVPLGAATRSRDSAPLYLPMKSIIREGRAGLIKTPSFAIPVQRPRTSAAAARFTAYSYETAKKRLPGRGCTAMSREQISEPEVFAITIA